MHTILERFKPAVGKNILLLVSGILWCGAGIMLVHFAYGWLTAMGGRGAYLFGAVGLALSWLIHHFGLLRIVDRNLARILPMEGKRCLFSFQPWKSYLIILVMVGMGIGLRHSSFPKPYLAIFYLAMGAALILSSIRYLKHFFQDW
jgi:hypothetical protein